MRKWYRRPRHPTPPNKNVNGSEQRIGSECVTTGVHHVARVGEERVCRIPPPGQQRGASLTSRQAVKRVCRKTLARGENELRGRNWLGFINRKSKFAACQDREQVSAKL